MAETSQRASRFVFGVFRQICRSNYLLGQGPQSHDSLAIATSVMSLTKAVDTFHATYDDWMDQCLANFLRLSLKSKQFAGLSPYLLYVVA